MEKTKSASVSAGEPHLRKVRFDGIIEKFSISANKTVDAIDSGLQATGNAAANLLGKMRPSNNQSYDLAKNE